MYKTEENANRSDETMRPDEDARAPYEPPKLLKKRSVSRVTLFSGSGASGVSPLTAS